MYDIKLIKFELKFIMKFMKFRKKKIIPWLIFNLVKVVFTDFILLKQMSFKKLLALF